MTETQSVTARDPLKGDSAYTVRLDIHSSIDMVTLVQAVTDGVGRLAGLGGDALDSVRLSVRECVSNAITHGNHRDPAKRVAIDFSTTPPVNPTELTIWVRDQGAGFDPSLVANPTNPDRLLLTSGRGIFLMRQLMDDVSWRRSPQGGVEVRMVKHIVR